MAENPQDKLINLQAQQLAAQVANWASQLEFQKERMRLLELPEMQGKLQIEIDKLAWDKARDTWEQSFKESSLTGTYQGRPTVEWLTQQAQLTGVLNGQQTLQGKLTDAQVAQMNQQMALANAQFMTSATGWLNGQKTFDREKFEATQATDAWKFLATLTGPANAFKQAKAIGSMPGGLQGIMGAWAGQYSPAGFAGVGSGGQASLEGLLGGGGEGSPYYYPQQPPPGGGSYYPTGGGYYNPTYPPGWGPPPGAPPTGGPAPGAPAPGAPAQPAPAGPVGGGAALPVPSAPTQQPIYWDPSIPGSNLLAGGVPGIWFGEGVTMPDATTQAGLKASQGNTSGYWVQRNGAWTFIQEDALAQYPTTGAPTPDAGGIPGGGSGPPSGPLTGPPITPTGPTTPAPNNTDVPGRGFPMTGWNAPTQQAAAAWNAAHPGWIADGSAQGYHADFSYGQPPAPPPTTVEPGPGGWAPINAGERPPDGVSIEDWLKARQGGQTGYWTQDAQGQFIFQAGPAGGPQPHPTLGSGIPAMGGYPGPGFVTNAGTTTTTKPVIPQAAYGSMGPDTVYAMGRTGGFMDGSSPYAQNPYAQMPNYTYQPAGAQAPASQWNYSPTAGGSMNVYPPGVQSNYSTPDISSQQAMSPQTAWNLYQYGAAYPQGYGSKPMTPDLRQHEIDQWNQAAATARSQLQAQAQPGSTSPFGANPWTSQSVPLPNQISPQAYNASYAYQKELGWAGYEDAGWDKALAQEAYEKSLPKTGGPKRGSFAF